jgi:hypothetical protein
VLFHRIHPWYIVAIVWKQIWELSKVNCKKRIVLPWAWIRQKNWNLAGVATNGFEKQLLLAQKYNKPVIHCVAAFQEVIDTKRDWRFQFLIIHGFSKRNSWLTLDNGFYISFGKYCAIQESVLRVIQTIDFSWKRIPSKKQVYTLAAKYKNITVTKKKEIGWRFKIECWVLNFQ